MSSSEFATEPAEQISQLPKSKQKSQQKFVMDMLDTVIQQAAH
ncbi:hypothetical protein BCS71_03390 [Vibrio lentus]|nr:MULTISPECIES: hypothetical protein [Vibrio]